MSRVEAAQRGAGRRFRDRRSARRELAAHLRYLRDRTPIVVGLPRGGVPVAYEVARALGARLDVVVVRKLGVPFQPELAMGAIAEGGARVLTPRIIHAARVTEAELTFAERREGTELLRRARRYPGGTRPLDLTGRTVVVSTTVSRPVRRLAPRSRACVRVAPP